MFPSLAADIAVFSACAVVIALVGTQLTGLADRLADRTGLGEAVFGALFLGAVTSLPGITASVTAAIDGRASLALANALGGIAVQTAFLVVGDVVYRRANLEHAAASVENMMHGALLIVLLALLLLGMLGPDLSVAGVHVLTPVLFVVYVLGQRMIHRSRDEQMWHPRLTWRTRVDEPDEPEAGGRALRGLWAGFALAAGAVISAGWALTRAAEDIGARTGLSDTVVGGLLTGVATSLPELVTCVAAVRRGALTLAVGGIIGGNAFDTLFAAVADLGYRAGSIYHAASGRETWLVALTVLMTAILLLGLLRRERGGFANIGFESVAVLGVYLLGMALLVAT